MIPGWGTEILQAVLHGQRIGGEKSSHSDTLEIKFNKILTSLPVLFLKKKKKKAVFKLTSFPGGSVVKNSPAMQELLLLLSHFSRVRLCVTP